MSLRAKWNSFYESPLDGQKLYLISFFSVVVIEFILTSTFIPYIPIKIVTWAVYPLILPAIFKLYFMDDWELKEKIWITLILFLAFLSWRKSASNRLLLMAILIFSAKNVDFNLLIKSYFRLIVILLLSFIFFSSIGFIDNLTYYRDSIARHSFGVDYPTDFAAYVFSAVLAYCYVYFSKLNLKRYVVIILIAIITNYLTNARLDTIAILLVVPVMYTIKKAMHGGNIFEKIASLYWTAFPILSFIAIYSAYFFSMDNKIFLMFNNLLSGRLFYSNLAFQKYGVSIFGQQIMERGWGGTQGHSLMNSTQAGNYFFIDSSYIRLIILYGIMMFIMILGVTIIISIRETHLHNYLLPGILMLLSISALIDQHFLEVACNPYLIALLATINRRNVKNGKI